MSATETGIQISYMGCFIMISSLLLLVIVIKFGLLRKSRKLLFGEWANKRTAQHIMASDTLPGLRASYSGIANQALAHVVKFNVFKIGLTREIHFNLIKGLSKLELDSCEIVQRQFLIEIRSDPIQCSASQAEELVNSNRSGRTTLVFITPQFSVGLNELVENIVKGGGRGQTIRTNQINIKLKLNNETNCSINSLVQTSIKFVEFDDSKNNKSPSTSQMIKLYEDLCETRNDSIKRLNYSDTVILAPDIFVRELALLLKNRKLISILQEGIEVIYSKRVESLAYTQAIRKLNLKLLKEISMAKVATVFIVTYLCYFGLSYSTMASTNQKAFKEQIQTIHKKLDRGDLENLQALYESGLIMSKLKKNLSNCSECDAGVNAQWQNAIEKYILKYETYLKNRIYPKLAYLADNKLGSKELSQQIYLHFRNQVRFLGNKDGDTSITPESKLGEILEVNKEQQKQVNYLYALYLDFIKSGLVQKNDLKLGQFIVRALSKNQWFIYWYTEYVNNGEINESNAKTKSKLTQVKEKLILEQIRKKERGREFVNENEVYFSPVFARWIAAFLVETDPAIVSKDGFKLITAYANDYYFYWYSCDEVWNEQEPRYIELHECRLPFGKTIAESIQLAVETFEPIKGYLHFADNDVELNYKKLISLKALVNGNEANLSDKLNIYIKEKTEKFVTESRANSERELLNLIKNYQAVDQFVKENNHWLESYRLMLKQGGKIEFVKLLSPLWREVRSDSLRSELGTLTLIFKRQLYLHVLSLRKNIIDEINGDWSKKSVKTKLEADDLRAFMDKNKKLSAEMASISDLSMITDPIWLEFAKYISPNISSAFEAIETSTQELSQVLQNNAVSIFSEPPFSQSGEKIVRSSIKFNCGKNEVTITNDNYRKSYELDKETVFCNSIVISAITPTGGCKATVKGNKKYIESMSIMLDAGYQFSLECDNGKTDMVDLGFRSNWDMFSKLNDYMDLTHIPLVVY